MVVWSNGRGDMCRLSGVGLHLLRPVKERHDCMSRFLEAEWESGSLASSSVRRSRLNFPRWISIEGELQENGKDCEDEDLYRCREVIRPLLQER